MLSSLLSSEGSFLKQQMSYNFNQLVSAYLYTKGELTMPTNIEKLIEIFRFFFKKKYKGVLYSESLTNFGVILAALYFPLRRNFPTGTMGLKPDKAPHKQLKKSCQQTLPRTPDLRQVRIWNINS